MFSKMKSIDIAFKYIRLFTIVVIVSYNLLIALLLFQRHSEAMAGEKRMWVMANGKIFEAFASERKDNIAVEAKDHIRVMHEDFFDLEPNEKVILTQITKALYLGDESIKRQYDNLKEKGYYSQIIAGNVTQRVVTDSIIVNTASSPYYFRFYGKDSLLRATSRTARSLVTEGYLLDCARSDQNPHGFLITGWNVLENNDLSPIK